MKRNVTRNDEIVMRDSPEAAQPVTVQAWRARDGYTYLDESTARYAGCTHVACRDCGKPTEKGWLICDPCRDLADEAKYAAMPRQKWNGDGMLYSDVLDRYYGDLESAEDDLKAGQTLADLRLVICEPNYGRQLDLDHFSDELPEDGDHHDLPPSLIEAVEAFNLAVQTAGPLSWSPGKFALDLTPPEPVKPRRGKRMSAKTTTA